MSDGIDFVPIATGLFGIAEIISNLEQRTHAHGVTPNSVAGSAIRIQPMA
jgi:TctA family transporter